MDWFVSIPNGHPRPFSPIITRAALISIKMFQFLTDIPGHLARYRAAVTDGKGAVSIPNGHPRPFSLCIWCYVEAFYNWFQFLTDIPGHLAMNSRSMEEIISSGFNS